MGEQTSLRQSVSEVVAWQAEREHRAGLSVEGRKVKGSSEFVRQEGDTVKEISTENLKISTTKSDEKDRT